MSESDTSLNVSAFIRMNQELNQLRKENSELLSHNTELNNAFGELKVTIGRDMEITEELRKETRSKVVDLEEEMKDKQARLSEARERIIQLEKELSNQSHIIPSTSKVTSSTYNALSNLTVEAGEVIQDIQDKLILDEQIINDMNTDRIQKLVRDTEVYEKAIEKVMSLKVKIRNELGNTGEYSITLQREAEETIENLTETKKELDNTLKMLEIEADERKIRLSEPDTDMSKFYDAPIFTGESRTFNIFEFFEFFERYLEVVPFDPVDYGAIMKRSLRATALNVVNKAFPNNSRPSMADIKTLLIKHFGKIENIMANLKVQHEEIGKIPDTGAGDMNVIYQKSSDHRILIQKALMLENNGCQLEYPKAYVDTIEKMLPPIYLDKFQSWEIEIENENAPNREKLEKLKELISNIEAKAIIKKSSLSSLPTTSKASFFEEPQDDNSDQESTSISDHDWFDTDEDESDAPEGNDETSDNEPHWNKPTYH